ncbi:zinc finger protein, putative [Plasmodium berghei]|uniref:Zinc finger protein, putative n=2 Tax=Plasmodium berghei TaxID=5821 RepID=A0A509AHT7_PLABA|nr:zinc finger protein, putative [Plasmodium berghei ANKA]CXI25351.1 zinc finger protein, putative [Plasmodium berghei]SCM20376.1 zinc finger protein, putative [Plasmodium berghei]SCN23975.1 zinc finger protein, putative [Plasmodium berghei]SCO59335.1 zinc finger protein, putative [Plasmodium berghei]SCO60425.1 zinc finger protein, putative [Plasmodium berghei]|eukprot:XP_034420872.1 zinc finger protein, putative [Plasmodium berghei ANKA]
MACTPLLSENDLYLFRTKQCLRLAKGGCEFGVDRCQYSHNTQWIRRCPYYISLPSYLRYIPFPCPYFIKSKEIDENKNKEENNKYIEREKEILQNCLFLTNKDGSVNNEFYKYIEQTNTNKCPAGVECPLAHSIEEIYYHPLVYKTNKCENYKHGNCNKYYCPNFHKLAEQRKVKEYFIPFSYKIDIPEYPNVTIVDKIMYGSFKGQSQINNKKKKKLQQNDNKYVLNFSDRKTRIEYNNNNHNCNNTIYNYQSKNSKCIPSLQNYTNNISYNCDYNKKEEFSKISYDTNKIRNNRVDKNVYLKYNSVNIPYANENISHINNTKYNTICYPNNSCICENSLKNKKQNSIFSYLNNCDDKFTLYVHILQKFSHLFDLNISNVNSNTPFALINALNISDKNVQNFDKIEIENSENRNSTSYYVCTNTNVDKKNSDCVNANNTFPNINNMDNKFESTKFYTNSDYSETYYKPIKENIENNSKSNTYYNILNQIFKKNLQITKNKMEYLNEKNSPITNTYERIFKYDSKYDGNLDSFTNYTYKNKLVNENWGDSYEDFINILSHILCLLYFTTNSKTHPSFDEYAQQLAKNIHNESIKMRDMYMGKIVTKPIEGFI